MEATGLRKEEGIGLAVAVVLHAAVLAALLVRPPHHAVVLPPQRIEVTIGDDVGLTSASPDPFRPAAADAGPEAGEPAPPPAVTASPLPEPAMPPPAPRTAAPPKPAPVPRAVPVPVPTPTPRPPRPTPAQAARPRQSSAIDSIVSRPSRTATAPAAKSTTPPRKAGSSAFADAFKDGLPGAKAPTGTGKPASEIGARERSALEGAIRRQLKPRWQAPQGVDADQLVTRVRFRLNPDGSLAGDPQVVSTTGQTAGNQAQVQRHQEQAVRAVRLAAPFELPADLYEGWKVVTTNFDRRLSQ